MALYKGNSKIRDRGTYGIYYGSSPIQDIYHGSDLVYRFQPYDTDEVLINSAGEITETITLQKGVYYIEITGGGGSSYTDSTLCSNVVHTQGYQNGAGFISITYQSDSTDYDYYEDADIYKVFNVQTNVNFNPILT